MTNYPKVVTTYLPQLAWLLSASVIAVAVFAWGSSWQWHLGSLTTYQVFPIFGLVAFSTMWSQYMVATAIQYLGISSKALHNYFRITGFIVLAAIMLHPGMLVWQLWRDGLGLPPHSYLHYVAPSLRWVALLGTVSFLIFIAYELRYKYGNRSWWRFMEYLVDLAILAIFYHALRLGTQTKINWIRTVWYFYGTTLIAALLYKYIGKYNARFE